jgi:hypothetical protein
LRKFSFEDALAPVLSEQSEAMGNPMQDLFQNYMDDLIKLREAFHSELTATAEDLTKAMGSMLAAVRRHWHPSWRKFRLVAGSSKQQRR